MSGRASTPTVTAIIPAYNGQEFIATAIESVLGQVGVDLELLVVDDRSSDGTADVARSYPGVQVITMADRGGNAYASANHGLSVATGEYVAILHQDDLWHPTKLATQVGLMESDPRIVLSYSALSFIDRRGKALAHLRSPLGRGDHVADGHSELRFLCIQNYINVCNAVVRRGALEAVGRFPEELWFAGEWSAWLRMAAAGGRVAYVDQSLSSFRVHAVSQTQSATHDVAGLRHQLLSVLEELFATPGLPRTVLERRRLALANVELSAALLSAYWSDTSGAISALGRLAGLLRPWEVPALIRASGVLPRTMARVRASSRPAAHAVATAAPVTVRAVAAGRGAHR